jgi:hypothetical protein
VTRRPARFTQADLDRALKAAEKAGADVAVDILPDGTIRLSRPQKDRDNSPTIEERIVF